MIDDNNNKNNNIGYLIPAREAESEFTEKRSRFIGQIRPVENEPDARRFLDEIRKKNYNARHGVIYSNKTESRVIPMTANRRGQPDSRC